MLFQVYQSLPRTSQQLDVLLDKPQIYMPDYQKYWHLLKNKTLWINEFFTTQIAAVPLQVQATHLDFPEEILLKLPSRSLC